MADAQSIAPTAEQLMAMLANMQQAGLASGPGLPLLAKEVRNWSGVAYKLGQFEVVSAMQEVHEMLSQPDSITPVPGTKEWFLGVTNIRGSLLPIVDLGLYLKLQQPTSMQAARILIIRLHDLHVGLLVTQISGIRHFDESKHKRAVNNIAGQPAGFATYVQAVFTTEEGEWPLFSLETLATDRDFRNAAC